MGGRGKAQRLPVSLRSAPERDGCIDYTVWQRPEVVASTRRSCITPVFSAIRTLGFGGTATEFSSAVIPETIGKLS
jgi:hypothetical protein